MRVAVYASHSRSPGPTRARGELVGAWVQALVWSGLVGVGAVPFSIAYGAGPLRGNLLLLGGWSRRGLGPCRGLVWDLWVSNLTARGAASGIGPPSLLAPRAVGLACRRVSTRRVNRPGGLRSSDLFPTFWAAAQLQGAYLVRAGGHRTGVRAGWGGLRAVGAVYCPRAVALVAPVGARCGALNEGPFGVRRITALDEVRDGSFRKVTVRLIGKRGAEGVATIKGS
jgi:hypothetical protein